MKTFKLLLATLFLGIVSANNSWSQSHNFSWAQPQGSVSSEQGRGIATDNDGFIYSTGFFRNTIDFDNSAGTNDLTSAGGADIFVKKVDTEGNFVWAVNFGGSLEDVGQDVTVDASGNVFIVGYFTGTADFDPGIGTANLTSDGAADGFIVKLDSDGNFLWVKKFGSTTGDSATKVSVDGLGNSYLAGYFSGTVDFDPGTNVEDLTSNGASDGYVVKLDASGNYQWSYSFGSTANDDAIGLVVDDAGNPYVSGYFNGTVDFDQDIAVQNLTTAGGSDAFLLKLTSGGVFDFVVNWGGAGDDKVYDIALDNDGMVLATGDFYGTADFDPGVGTDVQTAVAANDQFIVKLDQNGQHLWSSVVAGGSPIAGYAVDTDNNNNVFATGVYTGTADFDPGSGTANLTTNGNFDFFVLALTENGDYSWAYNIGGPNNDQGNEIAIDSEGGINVTGYFEATIDFDPTSGNSIATVLGGSDIFQLNFSSCADYRTDVVAACDSYTWIDGVTYTASNYSATDTLTNLAGCDSIISLKLTLSLIIDETVTPNITSECDSADMTITTASSEVGVSYVLRDDSDDSVLDGPIIGDGNGLTFNSGMIYSSTDFNVYAEKQGDYGVQFTATDLDRLEVDNPPTNFSDEITVEAWVKFDNTTNDDQLWVTQALFGVDNMISNVWLWTPVTDGMQWHVNNDGAWITITTTDLGVLDGWHHIATTADANETHIYIDGVVAASSTVGLTQGLQHTPTATLHIGGDVRYPTEVARHGDLDISDVKVWDVYKTQSEIATGMMSCLDGSEEGLVYYNKINDNSGVKATAAIGDDANFSTNMDDTDWTIANDVCDALCSFEMTQLASVTINTIDPTVLATEPTITAVQAGATYQWLDCDDNNSVIAGATAQSFTATSNGNYAVEVSIAGCADTSDCTQFMSVGFDDVSNEEMIIYPNPTADNIWVEVPNFNNELVARVYSMDGKILIEKIITTPKEMISLVDLSSGYYTLEVSNDSQKFINKIRLF